MKKIILLIVLIISTFSFSQDAKALLENVAETTKNYDNIYIEFTHKLDNTAANLHQETSGNVNMKGELYRFNYMDIERLFDGTKIYTIISEDKEVVTSEPKTNNGEIIAPSNILSFYQDGFTYEMDIIQNVKGKKIQFVKLVPTEKDSELKYIHIGIDTKNNNIYKVIQTGIDDTVTTITVTKMKTNQSISKQLFIFDKNKFEKDGYYITELN